MIEELKLKNWKSYYEAKLYIDPLTIVIGTNASGKSNMLDALLFLHRVSSGIGISQAINGDVNVPMLRGGIEWVCLKPSKQFEIEVYIGGANENQRYRYELTVQVSGTKAEVFKEELEILSRRPRSKDWTKKSTLFYTKQEEESPGLPTYFSTGTQGRGKRLDLNRSHAIIFQAETLSLRKEVLESAKYVLSQLQQIFVFDPIPSHMRNYTTFSEKLLADGSNIAGVLAGLDDEKKKEVEGKITHYLHSLPEKDIKRVWAEPVGKFKTDAMLYCEEGWQGSLSHEIDARGMSDGTLRYLAIVAALLTREPKSLLVIEEVDNGLHPSRAKILIHMLKTLGRDRNIDIIVTTHNPALLDAAGTSMLPFIMVTHRDDQTGYSKLTQLEDISQLPKMMAYGSIGKINTEGLIEEALKRESSES
ncbi:MAG: ATP-binding protein [Negativicutes bacterium]|jgi:predicted ATPase